MNTTDTIHVALAADQRYAPGLHCTVSSLLLFLDPDRPVTIHVLDGGIPDEDWLKLCICGERFHPGVTFDRISPDLSLFANFRVHRTGSLLVYARILLPSLLAVDRVIYLDTDLLVTRDVGELWDTDLKGHLAAASPDPSGVLATDWPWPEDPAISLDSPYFNTGVMLIDLDGWRRAGVQESTLECIRSAPEKCRLWDQTAFNRTLYGRMLPVETSWNQFVRHKDRSGYADMRCILHFVVGAPWLRHTYGDYQYLFSRYMQAIGEMSWRSRRRQLRAFVYTFALRMWRLLPRYYNTRAQLCRLRGQGRQAELFAAAAAEWRGDARVEYLKSRRYKRRNRTQIRRFLESVEKRIASLNSSEVGLA